jgi:hypothetical protein
MQRPPQPVFAADGGFCGSRRTRGSLDFAFRFAALVRGFLVRRSGCLLQNGEALGQTGDDLVYQLGVLHLAAM